MGICGLDGRSRAPRDGFMASHTIDTEQLRVAKLSFDGNQENKSLLKKADFSFRSSPAVIDAVNRPIEAGPRR